MKKKYEEITILLTLVYIMVSPLYFNYSNIFEDTQSIVKYIKIGWIVSTLFIALGYIFIYKERRVKFNRLDLIILTFPMLYFIPMLCGKDISNIRLNLEYILVSLLIAIHVIVLRRIINKERLNYILKTIILSSTISVIISFIIQSNSDIGNLLQIKSWFGDFYKSSVDRLYGTLLYPNTYATFILTGYFITCYYLTTDNKNIIFHFCLFILLLAFLLTMSKITTMIFLIINILLIINYFIRKKYKEIINLITIYFCIILPVLYAINKTRIFIYNNNLIIFLSIIILMFIIYYISYLILLLISKKSKVIYTISFIIILFIVCILFAFPRSQSLKISNITENNLKDNIIFADFMNLECSKSYLIKLDIKNKNELNNPILKLKVLYVKNSHIIKKTVDSKFINEDQNTYYFRLNTLKEFEYYYLELENMDIYNSAEISSVYVINLDTNKTQVYEVDNILTPYIYIHSKEQTKYDKGSLDGRMDIYNHVLEITKGNMLVGQGFRAFKYYSVNNHFRFEPSDEHSFIARMLVELGIIGVIYYFTLIAYGIVYSIRLLRDDRSLYIIALFLLLIGSSLLDINMSYEFIHFLLLLNLIVLDYNYRDLKNKNKVIFISSVGGHLTELLAIDSIYDKYDYILITEKNKISLKLKEKYKIKYLFYGSRYYMLKYVFISILNVLKSIYYFIRYNPDIIYTTGAHTSVLMCYLGYFFDRKIIFVEVFDRTHTPTLSGKLVYPIATTFIVQHNNYQEIYPKAKYIKGVY